MGINVNSGNFNYQQISGEVTGTSGRLGLDAAYNSLTTGINANYPTYNTVMGYGWTHNYNVRLIFPSDPGGEDGVVQLIAPRGSQMRFDINSDGTYSPFPAVLAKMTRSGSIGSYTYTVTTNSQYVYTFNNSGQLQTIADPWNNTTTLTYTSGKLTSITNASSQTFTLAYDGNNRLYTVTDSSSPTRTATFHYDGSGNLDSLTDMDGHAWTYTYATPSNHLLTDITDPSGTRVVKTDFDSSGRATAPLIAMDIPTTVNRTWRGRIIRRP